MKGNNEFYFNQATMVLAMQHYLEKIMQAPVPKVVDVRKESQGTNTSYFIIKISSEEKE